MSTTDEHTISSVDDLRALVGEPLERVRTKEMPALDARAVAFVATAPFLVLATSAADGSCDASPKGGPAGFVKVLDEQRLALPDFPGNRRFDGWQNLVERPGIGLLFVIPGITETLRVNGSAHLTRDPELLELCEVDGKARGSSRHRSRAGLQPLQQGVPPRRALEAESWPTGGVQSPSRTIAERSAAEKRPEPEIREEVDSSYELY